MDEDHQFLLNGAPSPFAVGATLDQLVEQLGLAGQALALAVNRQVVPRAQWPRTRIAADDRVEVVRAIGGG